MGIITPVIPSTQIACDVTCEHYVERRNNFFSIKSFFSVNHCFYQKKKERCFTCKSNLNIKNLDAYPNKKSIAYCIIFVEIIVVIFVVIIFGNIVVEMVICAAVDCKSYSRQGKAISFYKFSRNENLKQQLKKIKRSNT